jgi:hypothetical protein
MLFVLVGLAFPSLFCLGSFRKMPIFVYLFPRAYTLPAVY